MTHKIDSNIKNSDIEYCISEYVRAYEHRDILREKWFGQKTIEELASEHNMSITAMKSIIYDIGDDILLRAAKMSQNPD